MESIKHKMDLMIQEKNAAVEKAVGFEAETAGLETSAKKFEKEVDEIQRKIAKVEDELDITISKARNLQRLQNTLSSKFFRLAKVVWIPNKDQRYF